MALPTMRPQWTKSFKTPSELSKIQSERRGSNLAKCDENYSFFRKHEITANKSKAWTSQKSFKKSLAAIDRLFDDATKNERVENLFQRREKLRILLANENKQFQEELKKKRLYHGGKDLNNMQQRVDDLQAEKEEKRKLLAEEKLYEHWRKNEPRLREIESEKMKKTAVKKWNDQLVEKEEEQKSARDAEAKLNKYMELEHLKALADEEELEEERLKKKQQVSNDLRIQMSELHEREKETQILNNEEERLQEHQRLLHNAILYGNSVFQKLNEKEIKRKQHIEEKKKQEHGRVLIRQYKLQLKRKSKAVQEALELDIKILAEISMKEQEEKVIQTSRKEKLKTDAVYMQKVLADQLRLEKSREAELDLLYQEEASRQWRKRETEWERERLARERLMESVLQERQQQINEKMESVRKQQKASIEEREKLLEELEEHQVLTHREQNNIIDKKKHLEEELKQQITSRETERERTQREMLESIDRKRVEEQKYEEDLQREANRINLHEDPVFPSFRRKKVAFT